MLLRSFFTMYNICSLTSTTIGFSILVLIPYVKGNNRHNLALKSQINLFTMQVEEHEITMALEDEPLKIITIQTHCRSFDGRIFLELDSKRTIAGLYCCRVIAPLSSVTRVSVSLDDFETRF